METDKSVYTKKSTVQLDNDSVIYYEKDQKRAVEFSVIRVAVPTEKTEEEKSEKEKQLENDRKEWEKQKSIEKNLLEIEKHDLVQREMNLQKKINLANTQLKRYWEKISAQKKEVVKENILLKREMTFMQVEIDRLRSLLQKQNMPIFGHSSDGSEPCEQTPPNDSLIIGAIGSILKEPVDEPKIPPPLDANPLPFDTDIIIPTNEDNKKKLEEKQKNDPYEQKEKKQKEEPIFEVIRPQKNYDRKKPVVVLKADRTDNTEHSTKHKLKKKKSHDNLSYPIDDDSSSEAFKDN